jgi:hypothetical protein
VLASPSASFAHSIRVAVPVVCEINRNGASILRPVTGGRRLRVAGGWEDGHREQESRCKRWPTCAAGNARPQALAEPTLRLSGLSLVQGVIRPCALRAEAEG